MSPLQALPPEKPLIPPKHAQLTKIRHLIFHAARNVLRQRRRTAAAAVAVGFGIVAFTLAGGFIDWILLAMREDTIKSHYGHVQVVRPGYLDSGLAEPFSYLLPGQSPEFRALEGRDGVVVVAPRLSLNGLISLGETTVSFIADGVDPEKEKRLSTTLQVVAGDLLSESDPRGVILGQGLAASVGAKVGDKIVLLANTRTGGVNAVEAHVRGTFSTVTKAYDDVALRIPIAFARQLLRVHGEHRWVVLLDDTEKTDRFVGDLRRSLPEKTFEVVPWSRLADFYEKTVTLFTKQVGIIRIIIGAIIMLSITNTMMMSVMERTGEIGTAMALGNDKRSVLLGFLSEGTMIGTIGGIFGALVGFGLAHLISSIGIPMPPPPGMARGFVAEIRVTPGLMLDAIVLAVLTTVAASVYPALKASRLVIVDALRHNR